MHKTTMKMHFSFACVFIYIKILSLFSVHCIVPRKLPEDTPTCHLKRPNFDECLRRAIEDLASRCGKQGVPEVGVPPLDPGSLEALVIKAGTGAVTINIEFRDVKLHGISNQKVKKAHLDQLNKSLIILSTGDLYQTGDYKISGKLLMLPLNGAGKSNITFYKTDLTHTLIFRPEIINGITYFMVNSYHIGFQVKDHVHFYFEDLFNGDKKMSDTILSTINENWKKIIDEVQSGISYGYSLLGTKICREIFDHIPIDDIFLKD